MGGQVQTRCRSPYAWLILATGGQYFQAVAPMGNTATSRS